MNEIKPLKTNWKTIFSVGFAYVGIVTGAGLASGRELVQYFASFGLSGVVAVIIVGLLHALFGNIVLSLGSFYNVNDHSEVLSEVAHPWIHKFLDFALIVTCFVIGFVMIAGAGSNLNQQFGLPTWAGALICALLTILVCNLDFDKVAGVLGVFTPMIFVFLLVAGIYTFTRGPIDWQKMDTVGRTLPTTLPNIGVSSLNYFAMCILTGASMGFVLGGEHLDLRIASRGGLIGGAITGIITFMSSVTLFARIDTVGNSDLPMLQLIQEINPVLGLIMSIIIFGMIFNTAISLYYALAKRFSDGQPKRFRALTILLVSLGFLLSFFGFKDLLAIMYPLLGYMGIVLLVVLFLGWIANKTKIQREKFLRIWTKQLLRKKIDKRLPFGQRDQRKLDRLVEESQVDNTELEVSISEIVKDDILSETNNESLVDESAIPVLETEDADSPPHVSNQ